MLLNIRQAAQVPRIYAEPENSTPAFEMRTQTRFEGVVTVLSDDHYRFENNV
jgi:hypothetical protein